MLTPEEIAKIKAGGGELAAVAEKLEKAIAEGQMIPKSRFDEVNEAKKKFEAELENIRAEQKKLDDEKLRAQGEHEKLAQQARAELEKAKAELEREHATAEEFRKHRAARVEEMKKKMGDEWLPEYENFSLDSLGKLEAKFDDKKRGPTSPHRPGGPGAPDKTLLELTPAEREAKIAAAKAGAFQKR